MGKLIGMEGKPLRLLEEGEAANLRQMGQSEKYTGGPYLSPTCPGLELVFTGVQGGWELVRGDWRTGPERELLLSVGRWTEGTRERKSAAGNDYGGRLDCHGCRALLLSHTRGRATIVTSLSPHAGACQRTIKEACLRLPLVFQLPSNKKSPLRAGPQVPPAGQ